MHQPSYVAEHCASVSAFSALTPSIYVTQITLFLSIVSYQRSHSQTLSTRLSCSALDMKKEDSKSPDESGISGDLVGTLTMLLTEVDDEAELSPELLIKEEKIEEVMRELYKEISTSPSCTNVNPTSPPSNVPSPPPSLPFDVKSESCGASISVSGSTVMAGIEYVGPTGNIASAENGVWMVGRGDGNSNNNHNAVGEEMDGCDLLDVGDEWLARVLRWGPPLELEECK
ncbi:hypothetical protein KPL70_000513 [Citrus sinensis]|uniref:Uncharacterized protein n=1 Tax=Citrus clementina TaxID=85681 RepID=V4UIK8_CITCL|nr:hypothetical protein CICLE_v10009387mg [Citrus x clementina]KAH9761608.1 hypothetical protein KPL70_000513 [Citrus sinensis]